MSQSLAAREAYDREFARVLFRIHQTTGFAPQMIDIGGGWPRERDVEARTLDMNPNTIEDYARVTCGAISAELEAANMPLPHLMLEPGRYIAGNAGVLLTTIESIKPLLGAAVEGTFNHMLAATRMHDSLTVQTDVVGPLCIESVLREDCRLPDVERGDVIAILDAGMYAESDSHQLNWLPRPATVMVRDHEVGVVRAAETLDSIFATQRLPVWLRGVNAPPSSYRKHAIEASDD